MSADRPKRAVAIDVRELEQMLRGQVHSLCRNLLPAGREECGYWKVGSIAGEAGQSLAVNVTSGIPGLWTDFSAPDKTPERSGDMLWLIARVMFGGSLPNAIEWAISYLGLDGLDPRRLRTVKAKAREEMNDAAAEAERQRELKRRRAHGLYLSAGPLPGTIAETYLISRGIDLRAAGLDAPGSLKFHASVPCVEAGKDGGRVRKLPALIAAMVNLDGKHIATHRTWLRADGLGKAALVEPKKAMGSYRGGFIPIWKGAHDVSMRNLPEGAPVLVSEGIEDALSAALARPHLRVIAAVSLSNIGGLDLPAQMGPLVILAQHDDKQPAIDALETAIARQQQKGRDVRVAYPPDGVKDANDLLKTPDGAAGDLLAPDDFGGGVNGE